MDVDINRFTNSWAVGILHALKSTEITTDEDARPDVLAKRYSHREPSAFVNSIIHSQESFVPEMLDGFLAAHHSLVRRGDGGVLRRNSAPEGEVAVVIGGGSGHYPAFAGLVGEGLAHGAAMGNVFASPSTQQIIHIATAAHNGGGVLLSYGNYAGDVLNFDAAQQRLRDQGIRCETVTVTDDICSAPPERRNERRGIAGDLMVFRAAAAAAENGEELSEVARIARKANEATRSFGVAFSGCTLPGASAPLFSVPSGKMAVGLGIHGEPGIDLVDAPTASGLAELLVERMLQEIPEHVDPAHQRVVPMLNGLGALKYEELYVVFGHLSRILTEKGIEIIDPHVGEYCTSFDMCGLSLTLYWVDDELAELWEHPVAAPAYRKGAQAASRGVEQDDIVSANTATTSPNPDQADEESRSVSAIVVGAMDSISAIIESNVDELGRIDAVAGDGDHGIGMQRGAHAARAAAHEAFDNGFGARDTLAAAANAWSDKAGGTSGALWGLILNSIAAQLGNVGRPTARDVSGGVTAARQAVMDYGKAQVGDKTLVDALVPFAAELEGGVAAGQSLETAWNHAAHETTRAAEATATLMPRKGRARIHGDHALGTPDAGAHSLALIVTTVGELLTHTLSPQGANTPQTEEKL